MGLIFWGCCRKLAEQFPPRAREESRTRTGVTGSHGDACPLGINAVGPSPRTENRISSVATLLPAFANMPVIVGARPCAFWETPLFIVGSCESKAFWVKNGARGGKGRLVAEGEGGDRANMVCARVLMRTLVRGKKGQRQRGREKGKRGVISSIK